MEGSLGTIEVICGGMFSGKSEELCRRIRRAGIAKLDIQVFKPVIDNRSKNGTVKSHIGNEENAISIEQPSDIFKYLHPKVSFVAIDEAQFFSDEIVDVCEELANMGIRVVVAGLDTDFRGKPFGPIPALMAIAESVTKLRAICMVCGRDACRTLRIIDGKPADEDSPTVLIGASEKYEARCRECFEKEKKRTRTPEMALSDC